MDFYNTSTWKTKRQAVLARDKYQCQILKRYGKLVSADTVHHIFPRCEFPQYQLCDWNLISVSKKAHNSLHVRDTQELTEAGKELLRRTALRQGIPIPDKYK